MHITKEDIHPQLRRPGQVIRRVLPYFKDSTFRFHHRLSQATKNLYSRKYLFEKLSIERPGDKQDDPSLKIYVYKSKKSKANAPGILWMHGGGYAFGAPQQDSANFKDFIKTCGCTVVAVDYRLSLCAPYPAALLDCYAALLWLKKNAERLGVRKDQLMVAGVSAGGGLAAALALYARDRGEVAIAFQMPLYPMLDDRMITRSSQNNDAPFWNTRSNQAAWKLYLGSLYGTDQVPAYAAAARAQDLRGLPPAFTFVGGIEPFCDETVLYIKRLREAGIPAECLVYAGCFHAFNKIAPYSAPAKEARTAALEQLRYAAGHYFAPQND